MSTFVIDLDDTICTTPKNQNGVYDYSKSVPIKPVCNRINQLYNAGNQIIIFTSRGMRTYNGDTQKIEENVLPGILDFLAKCKIQYSDVIVGKPWGPDVYYIDDRGLTIDQFLLYNETSYQQQCTENYKLR